MLRTRASSLVVMMLWSARWILADTDQTEDVMKEELEMKEELAMTQLKQIASHVCHSYFADQGDIDACIQTFTNFTKEASKLQLVCRTKKKATFAIPPIEEMQLVALVPSKSTGKVRTSILRESQESISMSSITNDHYTVWTTTILEDGGLSGWSRGPDLAPLNPINYTIGEPSFEYVEKDKLYTANFTIDLTGAITKCTSFNIYNSCRKLVINSGRQKTIKPNVTSNQATIMVTVENLPINDECTLQVYNYDFIDNLFDMEYKTPIPKDTHYARSVTNVTLDVIPTGLGWDVQVEWDQPEKQPLRYNVTLLAPGLFRAVNVSGLETNCIFRGIPGKEGTPFNITIYSVALNNTSSRTVYGVLPQRTSYQAVIITGSWSVMLTVAAAAIGVFVWWRRRKALRENRLTSGYFMPANKQTKECLMESNPETVVEDSWELRFERILLHEVIGEGAFGVVRRGTLAPGVKEVAVKMLKDFPTPEEIRSFRAEMELMKSVGAHPHIVSLVGCCSGRRPLIVAEYCSRGDLLSFLRCSWDVMVSKRNAKYYNNNLEASDYRNDLFKKQKDSFPPLVVNKLYDLQGLCDSELTPLDLLSFCRQIAMGMEFLASNRVVHRDLAARNVLVTGDRTLKIADFGLSRDVYQENQYKQSGNGKMPVKWMALESLTHRIYTTMSDVWSFGVVVWEVVTVGGAPYPEVAASRLPRLLRAGYRMPRPNNCSKQLYDLMMSCWRAKPRDRPTFAELHGALDELLNSACADEYLSLELDYEQPPTPKPQRYLKMLLRGNRVWARGETYERPLKGFQSNHYTTPPQANAYQHSNCLKNSWLPSAGTDYRAHIGKAYLDTK